MRPDMTHTVKNALKKFFAMETAPGILLCLAAILAIIMENSSLSGIYAAFKDVPVVIEFGELKIHKHLLHFINDGLMAIFFLVVGLEIKREILDGHLSKREQITLPAVAALGGIIFPALFYVGINLSTPDELRGWAIPAATDIAFALGILLLLGNRIPASLKVCLVAIAIIDDLAAIIIIALFYTSSLHIISLLLAAVGLLVAFLCNRKGVTNLGVYSVIGIFIWVCVLKSGVHATLAGVALGLIIPMRIKNKQGKSPLIVMEHGLHPWVAFGVIPIFAFANAGVSLSGLSLESFLHPVTLGIMLGLFLGKQMGVMGITFLAVKAKICTLPERVNWKQYYGMACLTGIGFTMSLFIGTLAFDDLEHATAVRLGVLSGSILSGVLGVTVLLLATSKEKKSETISDSTPHVSTTQKQA